MPDEKKTNFWWWFEDKEVQFSTAQVKVLCERIKEFNAGAIDEYLSNHVDKKIVEWLDENKEE